MSTSAHLLRLAALPLLLVLASQLAACGESNVSVDASVTAGNMPVAPSVPVDEPPCLAI